MKSLRTVILSAITVLLLAGCESPVVFNAPQPEGVRPREAFQEAYQGIYYCLEDSAFLYITDCCLIKTKDYAFTVHRDSIAKEPGVELSGNLLYVAELEQTVPVEFSGDEDEMVHGVLSLSDTLFLVGPQQVLKYYRGHLVLNHQLEEGFWDVSLLSQNEDGSVDYYKTALPEDLQDLEKITPVKDISRDGYEQYRIAPTRAAFRELLETKLIFEGCGRFERVGDLDEAGAI